MTSRTAIWILTCLLGCLVGLFAACRPDSSASPAIEVTRTDDVIRLVNPVMDVIIQLPIGDIGYNGGSRFEQSGMVSSVVVEGDEFIGHIHDGEDPWARDEQGGLVSEFWDPVGYEVAAVGEPFLKIGVGLLKRLNDGPYIFHKPQEVIRFLPWEIETDADTGSAVFTQVLEGGPGGWGYRYTKTVSIDLLQAILVIRHELENTGSAPLASRYYCHHFFRINDRPVGPAYQLELPFTPTGGTADFASGKLVVDGRRLHVAEPMAGSGTLFTMLEGFGDGPEANGFRLQLGDAGPAVAVSGDHPIDGFTLWIHPNAFCPEPFVPIAVEPGATQIWTDTYRFTPGAG
ncbi:MAG: hypothetical protein ACFE0O_00200 [Opitutales bacterium]